MLIVQGHFTSSTTATGTYTYRETGLGSYHNCSTGSWPFTLTFKQGTQEPAGLLPPRSASFPSPPVRYVALGDSFSSGEGAGTYAAGTDTRANRCHRSTAAYPELFTQAFGKLPDQNGRTASLQFWACSGARTGNILKRSQGKAKAEGPQISRMTTDTDLVTVTIGGNDAGFLRMLIACSRAAPGRTVAPCDNAEVDKRVSSVAAPLKRVFTAIRQRAPHATVIVLDYPQLFPADHVEQGCLALRPWSRHSQHVLRDATVKLDDALSAAAAHAGVWFDEVREEFAGHAVCDPEPWVSPLKASLNPNRLIESFHPNAQGQRAYADALAAFVSQKLSEGRRKTAAGLPANPPPAP